MPDLRMPALAEMSLGEALRGDAPGTGRRLGLVLSAVAVLFLAVDAAMQLLATPFVLEAAAQLGYPGTPGFARGLGAALTASTLLYLWPRTAVAGAVLLTGYLGGAVAAHLRGSNPVLAHALFGAYLAVVLWGGLLLRDGRVRTLVLHR